MIHARTDYDHIQDPSGKIGDDEPVILFRARDAAFVAVLMFYKGQSVDPTIRKALDIHVQRALAWQAKYGKKPADMPPECLPPGAPI
jgi:hypothetical protein